MKKTFVRTAFALALILALAVLFAGCKSDKEDATDETTTRVQSQGNDSTGMQPQGDEPTTIAPGDDPTEFSLEFRKQFLEENGYWPYEDFGEVPPELQDLVEHGEYKPPIEATEPADEILQFFLDGERRPDNEPDESDEKNVPSQRLFDEESSVQAYIRILGQDTPLRKTNMKNDTFRVVGVSEDAPLEIFWVFKFQLGEGYKEDSLDEFMHWFDESEVQYEKYGVIEILEDERQIVGGCEDADENSFVIKGGRYDENDWVIIMKAQGQYYLRTFEVRNPSN